MNFTDFPALEDNVWSGFWRLALPLTVAFFVIFAFSYIQSAWDGVKRRVQRRQGERNAERFKRYSAEKF